MTREAADLEIDRLGFGLPSDSAGVDRLLERIAQHDDSEALRARLVEAGAEARLDRLAVDERQAEAIVEWHRARRDRMHDAARGRGIGQ
jgi:hypothetical protein